MRVYLKKEGKEWVVELNQGHQYFTLRYESDSKKDQIWMAKMFRHALKQHDKQQLKKKK